MSQVYKCQNFLEDMGFKPGPKHDLDRISVSGNYEPDNCQWLDEISHAAKSGREGNS